MFKPLNDNIIIEVETVPNTTDSGIVVPDSVQDSLTTGVVIAVGNGRTENGQLIIPTVVVGDQVVWGQNIPSSIIKDGNKEYIVVSERNILTIVKES